MTMSPSLWRGSTLLKQSIWNLEGVVLLLMLFLQITVLLVLRWFSHSYTNLSTHIYTNPQHVLVIWLGLVATLSIHVASPGRIILMTLVLFTLNFLCLHSHYLRNDHITTGGRILYCAIIACHFALCSAVSSRYRPIFPD